MTPDLDRLCESGHAEDEHCRCPAYATICGNLDCSCKEFRPAASPAPAPAERADGNNAAALLALRGRCGDAAYAELMRLNADVKTRRAVVKAIDAVTMLDLLVVEPPPAPAGNRAILEAMAVGTEFKFELSVPFTKDGDDQFTYESSFGQRTRTTDGLTEDWKDFGIVILSTPAAPVAEPHYCPGFCEECGASCKRVMEFKPAPVAEPEPTSRECTCGAETSGIAHHRNCLHYVAPWASTCTIMPRAEGEWWVRFTGSDAIYRWLHPQGVWVEEPDQIGMPLFKTYQEAWAAVYRSVNAPPTWYDNPAPPASDTCGKGIRAAGGHGFFCGLEKGHEGRCEPKREGGERNRKFSIERLSDNRGWQIVDLNGDNEHGTFHVCTCRRRSDADAIQEALMARGAPASGAERGMGT